MGRIKLLLLLWFIVCLLSLLLACRPGAPTVLTESGVADDGAHDAQSAVTAPSGVPIATPEPSMGAIPPVS